MPHWTEQLVERPWSKEHVVSLSHPHVYDQAAANGGSDKIRRHDPLSLASGHGRKAGTSGQYDQYESPADIRDASQPSNASAGNGAVRKLLKTLSDGIGGKPDRPENWERALKDGSRVVSVRDVKSAAPT